MTSKKIYYTSSREMLYESTCKDSYICQYCDADVWYESGDKNEALRISRKFAADTYDTGKVEICKNGVVRNVFEVCETLLDEDGDVVGEDTIEIVDPLDRMPKLRELADKADSIHCQLPSYITGKRKGRDDDGFGDELIVKWIPPIPINASAGNVMETIHMTMQEDES